MSAEPLTRRIRPVLIVALCVFASFFFSLLVFLPKFFMAGLIFPEFWPQVWIQLASWLLWAALLPLILAFIRRLRRFRPKPWLLWFFHPVAAFIFVTAHSLLTVTVLRQILPLSKLALKIKQPMPFDFFIFGMQFLVYGMILAAILGFEYYLEIRDRELKAAHLETHLVQARLQVLKTQIQPHFLFNTLNGISALIATDPEAAERMIGRLSELLRLTLKNSSLAEIPLQEEIGYLGHYLDIIEARHKDRVAFRIELDEGTKTALVPALLLQPLVENAVQHGITPRILGGSVDIRSRREKDLLLIEIVDDGPGFREDRAILMNRGLGLSNTQARLELLFGQAGRLKLENQEGGGARVEIQIPFHTEPRPVLEASTEGP